MKIVNRKSLIVNCLTGILFGFCLLPFAFPQGLPIVRPESVGMSSAKLNQIASLVNRDILDKKLPGAVVIVGRKGKNRVS